MAEVVKLLLRAPICLAWQTNSPFRLCFAPCSSGLNSRNFCLVWHACRHCAGKLLKSDLKLQPEPNHCGSILFEYAMKILLYKSTPKTSIILKKMNKREYLPQNHITKNSSRVLKSKRKKMVKANPPSSRAYET